jgi:hypothetical protein
VISDPQLAREFMTLRSAISTGVFSFLWLAALFLAGALAVLKPPLLLALPLLILAVWFFVRHIPFFLGFLAVYSLFEEFLTKWLPPVMGSPARYWGEALILLVFLHLLLRNWSAGRLWRRTPLDGPILLILAAAGLSTLMNGAPALVGLLGIKNLIRYFFLFYVVVNLDLPPRFSRRLLAAVAVAAIVVCAIGVVQSAAGENFSQVLKPRDVYFKGKLIRESTRQDLGGTTKIFSTLGRYNHLGNFLFFILCLTLGIYLAARKTDNLRLGYFFFALLCLAALGLSYSRMSWIGLVLGVFFIFSLLKQYQAWIYWSVFSAVLGLSLLLAREVSWKAGEEKQATLSERYLSTFSPGKFRQSFKSDRLYALLTVAPRVLQRYPILGVGPGTLASEVTGAGRGTPGIFPEHSHRRWLDIDNYRLTYISDSGWTSLLAQMGLLGLFAVVWLLTRVFGICAAVYDSSSSSFNRGIALGLLGVWAGLIFQNFVSFNLINRIPMLHFWLWLGIIANELVRREDGLLGSRRL